MVQGLLSPVENEAAGPVVEAEKLDRICGGRGGHGGPGSQIRPELGRFIGAIRRRRWEKSCRPSITMTVSVDCWLVSRAEAA